MIVRLDHSRTALVRATGRRRPLVIYAVVLQSLLVACAGRRAHVADDAGVLADAFAGDADPGADGSLHDGASSDAGEDGGQPIYCLGLDADPVDFRSVRVDADCASASLAIDDGGYAHVVFVSGNDATGTQFARYATNATGAFVTETIQDDSARIRGTGVVLDGGEPRVVLGRVTGSEVRYAFRSLDAWTVELVGTTGLGGAAPSIALAGAGAPVLVYNGSPGGSMGYIKDLYFATRDGGAWSHQLLSSQSASDTAVVSAADGALQVAWAADGAVYHAARAAAEWGSAEMVGEGDGPRLAIHPTDGPRMAWVDGRSIVYGRRGADGWTAETVIEEAVPRLRTWVAHRPGLGFAGDGRAHLTFSSQDCGVFYATRANEAEAFAVVRLFERGTALDQAVDRDGHVHLLHCESGLNYVTNAPAR